MAAATPLAVRFQDLTATSPSTHIAAATRLINAAYEVETGDSGVAFKNSPRFDAPAEVEKLLTAPASGCIVAMAADTDGDCPDTWLGLIVYESLPEGMYFGPFAVRVGGRGVGKALVGELERRARAAGRDALLISVINHRSDLLPMYAAWGFEIYGQAEYSETWKLTRPAHFILLRRPIQPHVGGATA